MRSGTQSIRVDRRRPQPRQPRSDAEQALAAFAANVTDRAILLVTYDGTIFYSNTGAERLFAGQRQAILGANISALVDRGVNGFGDDRASVLRGATMRFESEGMRFDGSRFAADVTVSLARPNGDRRLSFGYSISDITERKAAECALEANAAHMRSVLATVPDAMVVIDDHGLIQSFSAAAERLFGYTRNEVIGQNVQLLMSEECRASHDAYIAQYLSTGTRRVIGHDRIVLARRKDGSTFPIELSIGEAKGAYGRIFTWFVRDLSERRRQELRIRELQSELIHVSRLSAMGTMASILAHEINQPLTAISAYIDAARHMIDTMPSEAGRLSDALADATNEALRAGQIVRGLRSFVTRGKAERQREELGSLIEDAARLALLGPHPPGMRYRQQLDPDVTHVLADRVQIQQVLVNLIRNAVQAMRSSPDPKLTIRSKQCRDKVRISVSDTGCGVSDDCRADLFKAFTTTKADGFGIGLSISRTIVEAHGGQIWLDPAKSTGATFHFTLPLRDVNA
ncbi:PAS domain-containing sensor histidine kinase [Sphingomonas spermidinifaciens]|uniref:Sensor protein FixL n=2 Tax=Sphingomonas spermidinifaciens TaxID=1141889 RepID=A0A2A4AZL9_9SPHN|nr:PAS domain-containing sensor histidine kinase [Sphingomonas spermidinifaciens]